jgi:drug/metabolite transporter (DMT)-like permease
MNALLSTVGYGLAASLFWGSGDFSGGLAARRAKPTSVAMGAYGIGFVMLLGLAFIFHEPFPGPGDILWGALAGISGVIGLVAFYGALASGKMGLTAPIAGALTAALPVLYTAITAGLPSAPQLGGFALAFIAIILVARPEGGHDASSMRIVGPALLSGCGFGIFFILISRVSPATTFGSLAVARGAAVLFMASLQVIQRRPVRLERSALPLVFAAGALDALGNVFFLFAAHSGRLDIASVVSSLYPAGTVLLAALLLRERVQRLQGVGVLLALVAIPLISA